MDDAKMRILAAGSLLSSDAGIPPEVMDDVLDAALFSQLYADRAISRFDSSIDWLQQYDKAMQQLKWMTSTSRRRAYTPQKDASVVVEALVKNELRDFLPSEQVEEFGQMMSCMGSMAQETEISLVFRQRTVNAAVDVPGRSDVFLQIGSLEPGIKLSSLLVTFSTTSGIKHDLWRQALSGATFVGEVQVYFQQREWSPADNKIVRGKPVQDFLTGKKEGTILPISCETPEEDSDG